MGGGDARGCGDGHCLREGVGVERAKEGDDRRGDERLAWVRVKVDVEGGGESEGCGTPSSTWRSAGPMRAAAH